MCLANLFIVQCHGYLQQNGFAEGLHNYDSVVLLWQGGGSKLQYTLVSPVDKSNGRVIFEDCRLRQVRLVAWMIIYTISTERWCIILFADVCAFQVHRGDIVWTTQMQKRQISL